MLQHCRRLLFPLCQMGLVGLCLLGVRATSNTPSPTVAPFQVVATVFDKPTGLAVHPDGDLLLTARRERPVVSSRVPASPPSPEKPDPDTLTDVQKTLHRLPLSFEPNQGQTDRRVRFLARGKGYGLFLSETEIVLALRHPPKMHSPSESGKKETGAGTWLRIDLIGGNRAPKLEGGGELPGKVHYFLGNDPTRWRTNIPTYRHVTERDVYPGIDLVFYGTQGELEYDFVVAPGADPAGITLALTGSDEVHVDAHGDLVVNTGDGELRWLRPKAYQTIDGTEHRIAVRYVLLRGERAPLDGAPRAHPAALSPRHVGFQVAAYDPTKPLIIDPVLSYSTYLGGSGHDIGSGIAVDAGGAGQPASPPRSVYID